MSRGYYGLIGNQIYEIISNDYNTNLIVTPYGQSLSLKESGQGIYDIKMHLSNLSTTASTNKEMVDDAIAKLQTDKTKKITPLDSLCKMIVSYRLISGTPDAPVVQEGYNSPVVDEGTLVSNLSLHPAIFSLGLTLENEYVSRWALTTGPIKFERNFVQGVPLGISRHRESNYTLLIDRVMVIQKKYDDIRDVCIHPSIEYYNDMYPASGHVVTLYDSTAEGVESSPIYFNVAPKKISIYVTLDLNSYFVVADREDIVSILDKNIEAEKNADDNKGGELEPGHVDDRSDVDSEHPTDPNPTDKKENTDSSDNDPSGSTSDGDNKSETTPTTPSESGTQETTGSESNTGDPSTSETTKDDEKLSASESSSTAPSETPNDSE